VLTLLAVVRTAFFAAAALFAVVCLVDWLVRTRRISPFNGVARFFRKTVDPLMLPIERRVVRAGGQPANAPWWALAAVVIGGILVLSLINTLLRTVGIAIGLASQGPSGLLYLLVWGTFRILSLALLVRVLSSWIPGLSPYSPWLRWAFALSEPILRPLRQVIPTLGMIDITPIAAYFLLGIVEGWVLGAIR
jgi:YggT family protein